MNTDIITDILESEEQRQSVMRNISLELLKLLVPAFVKNVIERREIKKNLWWG
ncbi:MAG: hypothetical protein ACFFDT_28850 [Candidatus Hodarchaeota archaeon]